MARREWVSRLAAVLLLSVLGLVGWTTYSKRAPDRCFACNRPIHANSRTTAAVNGHKRFFCCPACALSQHEQGGQAVTITQLTSFDTGQPIAPGRAYLVRGSDVNLCEMKKELVDSSKHPADLLYDRCAPSLIAFDDRDRAMRFATEHGGVVEPFSEAAAAFTR